MKKKLIVLGLLFVIVFAFTACDLDNGLVSNKTNVEATTGDGGEVFIETSTDGMIELHSWFITSGVPSNAIILKHTSKTAVFECFVDQGSWTNRGSAKVFVKAENTIYWFHSNYDIEQAFVEIILREDENIIGYAVIGIVKQNTSTGRLYKANILKAAFIPKIDGEYQNITDEQIKVAIENSKTSKHKICGT